MGKKSTQNPLFFELRKKAIRVRKRVQRLEAEARQLREIIETILELMKGR